jgi:tRNA threonylcarbamoyladenosine biosynthesis protein TsaE
VSATVVESVTPEETEACGERLGAGLGPGAVVACVGELGAGKTCFVRGLARGLGVAGPVTSPTFALVHHYRGRVPVFHIDVFRTGSAAEVRELGLDEMLSAGGVTIIEWADRFPALLPADAIRVSISGLGDEPRRIAIQAPVANPGDAPAAG